MHSTEMALEVPQRKADLPCRLMAEDRGMLLDLDSGNYYELSGAGPYVWAHLDGILGLDEVARQTAAAYGVRNDRVLEDLRGFVDELRRLGLLAATGTDGGSAEEFAATRDAARALPYAAPSVSEKGNLKYLGQLD